MTMSPSRSFSARLLTHVHSMISPSRISLFWTTGGYSSDFAADHSNEHLLSLIVVKYDIGSVGG